MQRAEQTAKARALAAVARLREAVEAARDAPRLDRPLAPELPGSYRASARPGPVFDPTDDARHLFEPGGGKMFGVLVAADATGERHELRAFSGMYLGRWTLPGWVGPCFDPGEWYASEARHDPAINAITDELVRVTDPARRRELGRRRAELSRAHMRRLHGLVRLITPTGAPLRLEDVVDLDDAPSGMGDCCAPKLLSAAHARGWRPLAVAEIFLGVHRRPAGRPHGSLHPPCEERCGPLLPHLLGACVVC